MAKLQKIKSRRMPTVDIVSSLERLSADVFGSLFRGPDAAPAVDLGLWDAVFEEAFGPSKGKSSAEQSRANLHVVNNSRIGKRTRVVRETFARKGGYAVTTLNNFGWVKFSEAHEYAMNLGFDPRRADQMVPSVVGLSSGTRNRVRVAVFARGVKADEARAAGADIVGAEELVKTVQGGKIEFDRCIATPDMMPIVRRLSKVLVPHNLMPNPIVGTVTMDVKAAVTAAKGGEVQIEAEKAGVVHVGGDKAYFDEANLGEAVRGFITALEQAKPTGAKGAYMKKVSLSSTTNPGVRVDPNKGIRR